MKARLPQCATTLLPVLMLPLAVASLWLLVAPTAATPRALIVLGTLAVAWYLLGGWMSARELTHGVRLMRQIRESRDLLAGNVGCVWLVDETGGVRGQSHQAEKRRDLMGQSVANLLAHDRADPKAAAERILRRLADGKSASVDFGSNERLTAERVPGTMLQLWRIAPEHPEFESPVSPVSLDLAAMPLAMLDMDVSGRVRAANPAAEALLGHVTPGMALSELVAGLGRPLSDWFAEVREGRSNRSEVMQTRADGQERDVQVTLAATPGTDRMVAVLTDASALKTLEAQFVQSQKMQAIGQLAGGIAHDFNNLLTAISGHCDLLMVSRDKTDADFADLHQISENANRAAALVRQLLAFSRKQTLNPEIIDLRDTLSDLTHLLNRLVGERIILTIDHDPSLRPIRADARQLEQVLMNLVVNARDAMPSGGEISIRADGLHLGNGQSIEGANLPRGDYVRITVTDQGCGMSPEIVDKIFEPFFTTKRVGEGTGLGLSTAYGIVKQTGGYIFCKSELGEGTTFSLYFPAQKKGQPKVVQPADNSPATLPGAAEDVRHVVLLVEDEAPVRAFASRALGLRGFEVIAVDSGEAALRKLDEDRPVVDIFVTDVIMPGLDGPAWVRQALNSRPGTPVIFMSGYTDMTHDDVSDPVPNAIFLAKPFSLNELVANVETHVASRGVRVVADA